MKLFELRIIGLPRLLAAGLYGRTLALWIGTRPLTFTFPAHLEHAAAFRPSGPARW